MADIRQLSARFAATKWTASSCTWEAYQSCALATLTDWIKENQPLRTQLRAACSIAQKWRPDVTVDFMLEQYRTAMAAKYAFRRYLEDNPERAIGLARSRFPIVPNGNEMNTCRVVLFAHFGAYLPHLVSAAAMTDITFVARRTHQTSGYTRFLSILDRNCGARIIFRFRDALAAIDAGETICVFFDQANLTVSERNRVYCLGRRRIRFDSAADQYAIAAVDDVAFVHTEPGSAGGVEPGMLCSCQHEGSAVQTVLDSGVGNGMIRQPWHWDRLKYIEQIVVEQTHG